MEPVTLALITIAVFTVSVIFTMLIVWLFARNARTRTRNEQEVKSLLDGSEDDEIAIKNSSSNINLADLYKNHKPKSSGLFEQLGGFFSFGPNKATFEENKNSNLAQTIDIDFS